MKKLTTTRRLAMLLAAVFALSLLSSCGGDAPNVSDTPSGAPETSPTPEVNYLADPMFDTDEYLPDYDETCTFRNNLTFSSFCETDTVCYGTQKFNRLMFWDKQTGICAPLCGKPECDHGEDTLTCNAKVRSNFDVCFYDGKIYFTSFDPVDYTAPRSLWSINPDGTSREKVLELEETAEFNEEPLIYPHRGYVYCSGIIQLTADGVPSERLHMFAKSLATGETVEILDCTYPQSAFLHYSVQWSGNNLYILKKADPEIEILRWDSKTRTLESLYFSENEDISFSMSDLGISEDGKTLYIAAFENQDDGSQLSALYELNPETRKLTKAFTIDDMGSKIGFIFGKVYVTAIHGSKTEDGTSSIDRLFVKDLDNGEVIYEGLDLPEGVERGDVVGLSYVGGNRDNLYLLLHAKDETGSITSYVVCLSLGDTPKMSILWDEYY